NTPRNFFVEPSGRYLFAENQQSGTIVVLKIDQQTGALSATGSSIEIPSPVCIRTIPVQKYLPLSQHSSCSGVSSQLAIIVRPIASETLSPRILQPNHWLLGRVSTVL
ncbi:MAG: beta-propeller fold lactonase family protein, partial [Planctomycetota bacterium]